jgi:hypothetical protein
MTRSEIKTVALIVLAVASISSWVTWEIATGSARRMERRAQAMVETAYLSEMRAQAALIECQFTLIRMYQFPEQWREK